jgi:hypothetical protein
MNAVVRWSPKARGLFALFLPFFAWLAWYSFTSARAPSPPAGVASIVMGALSLVFQAHLARFRVEAGPDGITAASLGGVRRIPWGDVLQVDAIGRATDGDVTRRFRAAPEHAFDVIVHTRHGRVALNRWMSGVDGFVAELHVRRGGDYRTAGTSPLARKDPSVEPVLRHTPVLEAATTVASGLTTIALVFFVGLLSLLGGFIVVATTPLRPTGNIIFDGALASLVPWALAYGVYRLVCRARERRFGPPRARWRLGTKDVVLTVFAAFAGPLVLYAFVPRAMAGGDATDLVICAAGLFMCGVPIGEIRSALRVA